MNWTPIGTTQVSWLKHPFEPLIQRLHCYLQPAEIIGNHNAVQEETQKPAQEELHLPPQVEKEEFKEITEQILPSSFMWPLWCSVPLNKTFSVAHTYATAATIEISGVSILTWMEKELKAKNIWNWVGNITKIRTQIS